MPRCQRVWMWVMSRARDVASRDIVDGSIVNADVNASAAIAASKLSGVVAQSLVDAKGDLLVGTANDTVGRLAAGTNGHVLTADSTTATGLKWAAAAGGGGKVLQVVSAVYGTETINTSAAFADTGLSATITPTSATSKILVLVTQSIQTDKMSSVVSTLGVRLVRGSTTVFTPHSTTNVSLAMHSGSGTRALIQTILAFNYLDDPATTSATTYKTQFIDTDGTAIAQPESQDSSIILMEIGA